MSNGPPRVKNILGKTFGEWVVLSYAGKKNSHYYVLCRCTCGTEKSIQIRNLVNGRSKSCGCQGSLEKRFWKKVDKSGGPDACWLWVGGLDSDGYGNIWLNKKTIKVHRVSWELHRGPIPRGLYVCHHCDNPPCVNPDHLFLGTNSDNMCDMIAKDRGGVTKLTVDQVHEIRGRIANGETQRPLGKEFGVSQSAISRTINRKSWKHV